MDTKSKKFKPGRTAFCVCLVLETLLIFAEYVCLLIYSSLGHMWWIAGDGDVDFRGYTGRIISQQRYSDMMNFTMVFLFVGGIAAVALLILLIAAAGNNTRDGEGRIQLNFIEHLFTEIHIAVMAAGGLLLLALSGPLYYIFLRGDILGVWRSDIRMNNRSDDTAVMVICLAAALIIITIMLFAFLCVVKKIKAKAFWKTSLTGTAFSALVRGLKKSDNTTLKIAGVLIAAALLSATWIGLPFVIIGIIIFIPKMAERFTALKKGVAEIKNGNLDYKIPVEADEKGVKGEIDRLAEDINEIADAEYIAVQNELKDQRMKTDLISNVSHDLRTPLTSMITYIDLLKKEGLDGEHAQEYLDVIDQKTHRLKSLTDNLFDAAKASSGAIPVNMETIDLSAVITQSLAEMDEKLAVRGLDVNVSTENADTRILADGQLMWRVMENLLGNISKYAMDNSRVYIDVREGSGYTAGMIVTEIKNISRDRLNIPEEELMERFKRGDESRNTDGSGLGLAITRDLVRLMEGRFDIHIDGDLFKVVLAMKKAHAARGSEQSGAPYSETARPQEPGSKQAEPFPAE